MSERGVYSVQPDSYHAREFLARSPAVPPSLLALRLVTFPVLGQTPINTIEEEEEDVAEEEAEDAKTATQEKDMGNELFKQGDVRGAIAAYTRSLRLDPASAAVLSNRAAAHLKVPRARERCPHLRVSLTGATKGGLHARVLASRCTKQGSNCANNALCFAPIV